MNFFDDIYDSAKIALDITSDKAEEIIEKGKTQMKIRKLRRKLKESYAHLGLRLYIKTKRGEEIGDSFEMQMNEIDKLRKSLSELKEQADFIKYFEKCSNCGSFNAKEDEFCLNCGTPLKPFRKAAYKADFNSEE